MESLRPRGVFEYLSIFWGKKLLILLVTLSVFIAAYVVVRRIPSLYEARALIVIAKQATDDQLLANASLAPLMQQMTSQGNLAMIVRRYDLYHQSPKPAPDLDSSIERLRKEIKTDIKMRNYYPDAPESLTITFRYRDPGIAQRVVADVVSIYEQANANFRRQSSAELERFRSKISEVEGELQRLAPHSDLSLLRSGLAARPDEGPTAVRAQRLNTANMIDALSDKEFTIERQIDEQKKQIAEQEKLVRGSKPTSGLVTSGAYGVLLTRRAELEGQVKELSLTATEKNPKMIQARTQLSEVNREIAKLESSSGTSVDAAASQPSPDARELRTMERELQRLQTDLEVTQRDLKRKTQSLDALPQVAPQAQAPAAAVNDTKPEYDRMLVRYNWLMDKQEAIQKLIGGGSGQATIFQVIDPPFTSRLPVAPNRNLLLLVGLGIALGLGLLAAAARELPRLFLIHNDRDVEFYLGTPVLAMIPETVTPFERSRRRRLSGLRWVGLGLLATMMIPIFVTLLDRIQIFQILGSR
jgi:uncharacterized protein involved in exopolysaccharide biosynthesis